MSYSYFDWCNIGFDIRLKRLTGKRVWKLEKKIKNEYPVEGRVRWKALSRPGRVERSFASTQNGGWTLNVMKFGHETIKDLRRTADRAPINSSIRDILTSDDLFPKQKRREGLRRSPLHAGRNWLDAGTAENGTKSTTARPDGRRRSTRMC